MPKQPYCSKCDKEIEVKTWHKIVGGFFGILALVLLAVLIIFVIVKVGAAINHAY